MKAGKKIKKPLQTTLGKASEQDKIDLAEVRKPIHTSISDLRHVFAALQNATEEVKNYLINECDIIYECRMCRSLFRSLANFILHKRSYCHEKFVPLSVNHATSSQVNKTIAIAEEESANEKKSEKGEAANKHPGHDLTSVIEKLKDRADVNQLTQDVLNEDLSKNQDDKEDTQTEQNADTTILLEKIASNNAAAFQTVIGDVAKEFLKPEYMRSEVMEIHHILDNDEAILGPDGKICNFKLNATNSSKDVQKNDLTCSECNLKFSTVKTLTHHVKYKHNDTRLVYICPDCKDTFANPWCVYRHLLKVHRRTTAQIRRLREQIHNSVIKMKDYEPYKKKHTKKDGDSNNIDKTDEENQWLNNIEGDKDFQMCGGCGKRFERKAALHSHAQMCIKRIAVCNTIKENSARKKEEECKDQNKSNRLDKIISKVLKGASKRKPCVVRTFTPFNKTDDDETRNNCDDVNCDSTNRESRESSPVSSNELKSPLENIDTEGMLDIIGVSVNYNTAKESISGVKDFNSYENLINQQLIVEIEAITNNSANTKEKISTQDAKTESELIDNENGSPSVKQTEDRTAVVDGLPLIPQTLNLEEIQNDNQETEPDEIKNKKNTITRLSEEVSAKQQQTTNIMTRDQNKQHEAIETKRTTDKNVKEVTKFSLKLRRRKFSSEVIDEEKGVEKSEIDAEKMKTQKEQCFSLVEHIEDQSCEETNREPLDRQKEVIEDTVKPLTRLRKRKSSQEVLEEPVKEYSSVHILHDTVEQQKKNELPTIFEEVTEPQNQTDKAIQNTGILTANSEKLISHLPKLRKKRRLTELLNLGAEVTCEQLTENQEYNEMISENSTEQEKRNILTDSENVKNIQVDKTLEESQTDNSNAVSSCRISVRTLDELMESPSKDNLEQRPTETSLTVEVCRDVIKQRLQSDANKLTDGSTNIQQSTTCIYELNFSSRAAPYMDKKDLRCIPCKIQFTNFAKLMKHMAAHFNWYRFQCSKCSFISFSRSDCSVHALENHNINSSNIPSVVLPIPDWKIDLMSRDFHELTNVDAYGEGYEDMIIECKEEPALDNHNELSRDSSVIYIDNLFEDSQNIEIEVEDVAVDNNAENEIIDIIEEEEDSYKIDLSLEIYSTKLFEGINKLGENETSEKVNTINQQVNVKIESDIESESEYYIPIAKKTYEPTLDTIKQETEVLGEDFSETLNNNDDNMIIKSNNPVKKILPTRNRKKSVKTLQNDFVYDFNKFFKLNDCSVNKINSVQKQKKASSPTKASTSSTSKIVKISQKRK